VSTPTAQDLPEDAQRLFAKIVASSLAAGDDVATAEATAWKGLSNAGWSKDDGGRWTLAKSDTVALEPVRIAVAKREGFGDALGFEARMPITKFDTEGDVCRFYGFASIVVDANANVVIDKQREVISVEELEKAAARFVTKSREINAGEHFTEPTGQCFESIVLTPSKRVAMGLDGTGPSGWWIGCETKDRETIAKIRSGDLREFSIEGSSIPKPIPGALAKRLTDLEIDRVLACSRGAGQDVRIAAVKSLRQGAPNVTTPVKKAEPMGLDAALAMCPPEAADAIKLAMEQAVKDALAADQKKEVAASDPKPKEEDMPPAVAKAIADEREKTAKAIADSNKEREILAKRLADAEERAQAAQDKEDLRVSVAKASSEFSHLPVPYGDMGAALLFLDRLTAKDDSSKAHVENIRAALSKANTMVKNSEGLRVVGSHNRIPDEKTAEGKLTAQARALIAKSDELREMEPARALRTALAKVSMLPENEELYEQFAAEQAAARSKAPKAS